MSAKVYLVAQAESGHRYKFVPEREKVMELQFVRSPLMSLKVKDVAEAAEIHGALAAVLAVFRISRAMRSMPILPLWDMPSRDVAWNHPFTP